MNIGKSIRRIREENHMSQEEFGALFFVTRQTISNWENEKSYPDLGTLVKLSDRFDVSLDKLLKEDPEMVNTITKSSAAGIKWNKLRRTTFIIISALLVCILIGLTVYGAVWRSRKSKLEAHFNNAISELGFVQTQERVYILSSENGITYTLPHQEMPSFWDFSTDFHAKHLDANFVTEQCSFTVRISGEDMYSLQITDLSGTEEDAYIKLDSSGKAQSIDKRSTFMQAQYNENADTVTALLKNSLTIYNKVYI